MNSWNFLSTLLSIDFGGWNITVFGSRQVFDESILLHFFKHYTLNIDIRQKTPKLILYTILYLHPKLNFINKKGCQLSILLLYYVTCHSLNLVSLKGFWFGTLLFQANLWSLGKNIILQYSSPSTLCSSTIFNAKPHKLSSNKLRPNFYLDFSALK